MYRLLLVCILIILFILSIYLPAIDPDICFCTFMIGSYYVRVHDILSIME